METLQTVLNCRNPGCPKNNIYQSGMIVALCGMAVALACMGVASESFREVLYLIGGAIAFIKLNWNQGQIQRQAETAASVAVQTKETLEQKAEELKQVATDAVVKTVEGNAKIAELTTIAVAPDKVEAFHAGLEKGRAESKLG